MARRGVVAGSTEVIRWPGTPDVNDAHTVASTTTTIDQTLSPALTVYSISRILPLGKKRKIEYTRTEWLRFFVEQRAWGESRRRRSEFREVVVGVRPEGRRNRSTAAGPRHVVNVKQREIEGLNGGVHLDALRFPILDAGPGGRARLRLSPYMIYATPTHAPQHRPYVRPASPEAQCLGRNGHRVSLPHSVP